MTCHILDICDMTHWYMWHDTLIYVTWLFDICGHMTMHTPCYYLWHTPMSHATQIHKLCITNSSKWWVSFAKESYKRDNILQKRPIILRSLLIVATPQANESRHTDEQSLSHVNLLCHVSMSQVTCEFVMSRINKSWRLSCHVSRSHDVHQEHVTIRQFTHPTMTCGICAPNIVGRSNIVSPNCSSWFYPGQWVVSHTSNCQKVDVCDTYVSHINESWNLSMSHGTYLCVKSHIKKSCHIYQWVMSHISKNHVTYINESCHIC